MTEKKDLTRSSSAVRSPSSAIDTFLDEAKRLAPAQNGAPRAKLVFALDATMSRQPTWDLACRVQAGMFAATSRADGLAVQLVYFRQDEKHHLRHLLRMLNPVRDRSIRERAGNHVVHTSSESR